MSLSYGDQGPLSLAEPLVPKGGAAPPAIPVKLVAAASSPFAPARNAAGDTKDSFGVGGCLFDADNDGVLDYVALGVTEGAPERLQTVVVPSAQNDEALGVVTSLQYSAALDTPDNRRFTGAYRRRYNKLASYYAESMYTGGKWVLAAIEALGFVRHGRVWELPGHEVIWEMPGSALDEQDHAVEIPTPDGQVLMLALEDIRDPFTDEIIVHANHEINEDFADTDVAVIIGANDVVNPVAREPGSPISGMPILNVDEAQHVIVLKRGPGAGFAGIPNPLFTHEKTAMLFGDAKHSVEALVQGVKSA